MIRRLACSAVLVVLLLSSVLPAAEPRATGFLSRVYKDDGGQSHRYVVFVPDNIDKVKKPPLLMFLHGSGERGNNGLDQIMVGLGPALWKVRRSFPFVTVFPQCNKSSDWTVDSPDGRRALAILTSVAKTYGTDPDRVYLTGLSMGGAGTWSIASKYPRKFAAIAPMCAGPRTSAAPLLVTNRLPIWNFCGDKDSSGTVSANRKMHKALLKVGGSPRYTEYPGVGHNCWDDAYNTPALFTWFLEQSRSGNAGQTGKFVSIFNGRDLTGWKIHGTEKWYVDKESNLVCESGPDKAYGYLATTKPYGDFEIHLEFQLVANGNSGVFFRSQLKGTSIRGWQAEVAPPNSNSGGVYESGGRGWLAKPDAQGQAALRATDWNDYRIKVVGDHVVIHLNGWKSTEFRDKKVGQGRGVIALQIHSGGGVKVRWRNIRIRTLGESK